MSNSSFDYEIPDIIHYKRRPMYKQLKIHHEACKTCLHPFEGVTKAVRCSSCKIKLEKEVWKRGHCGICSRQSHSLFYNAKLDEYHCSFCKRNHANAVIQSKTPEFEVTKPRTLLNPSTINSICPVCKKEFSKTPRQHAKIWCSDECKFIARKPKKTETYYALHKTVMIARAHLNYQKQKEEEKRIINIYRW